MFHPVHVAEVGVHLPHESNILEYIARGTRTTLVEPDPVSIAQIQEYFKDRPNVALHKLAVCDHDGSVELIRRDASTFMSDLPQSPAIVNDGYRVNAGDAFKVEARTFDKVDDGTIDLLSVDIEGGEWFVIKHMTSRPAVISLETHGAAYVNPFIREIAGWMGVHAYRTLYKTKTDTVYVDSRIGITVFDRMLLALMNAYLGLRRLRKSLGRTNRRGC